MWVSKMYKSPIEVIAQGVQTMVENNVYKVVESCGINVNKDELLKALQYDRNQYAKGYEDGFKEAMQRLTKMAEFVDIDREGDFVSTDFDELKIHYTVADAIKYLSEIITKEMESDD